MERQTGREQAGIYDSRVVICGWTHSSFGSDINLIFGLQNILIYESAVELVFFYLFLYVGI